MQCSWACVVMTAQASMHFLRSAMPTFIPELDATACTFVASIAVITWRLIGISCTWRYCAIFSVSTSLLPQPMHYSNGSHSCVHIVHSHTQVHWRRSIHQRALATPHNFNPQPSTQHKVPGPVTHRSHPCVHIRPGTNTQQIILNSSLNTAGSVMTHPHWHPSLVHSISSFQRHRGPTDIPINCNHLPPLHR